MSYGTSVQRLMEELGKLPGIGPKTAERLAHHLLQVGADEALRLARAIEDVKANVRLCPQCFNLTEGDGLCGICRDPRRDPAVVCVVEQARDLVALEKTAVFHGHYHVLGGRIAPLEGMTADRLTIAPLVDRVRKGVIKEVIIATNPTLEGEGTALHVSHALAEWPVKVTRLARGLATGMSLEFANKGMLEDALTGRRDF